MQPMFSCCTVWQSGNNNLLSDEFIILCVLQQARSASLMSTAF